MVEQSKPEKNIGLNDGQENAALFKKPDIRLLDDKQWLYIQRCYRLSPRELQVARHVCQGFANEEIARSLRIRLSTVKTHLRNIYRRINVTNKIGMLLTFLEVIIAASNKSEISSKPARTKEQGHPGSAVNSEGMQ